MLEAWPRTGTSCLTAITCTIPLEFRTCATPEFLKGLERPKIFDEEKKDDDEWKLLYDAARALIGTSEREYDHSVRHNVVLNALKKAYPNRGVKSLPLACHRLAEGSPYVQWHAPDNVSHPTFSTMHTVHCVPDIRRSFYQPRKEE